MFFRKKPRKKIFLTNIHYDCFDLLNYWLDAVAFHALVNQPLAAYDTDVSQATVADSRGEALRAGKIVLGIARGHVGNLNVASAEIDAGSTMCFHSAIVM